MFASLINDFSESVQYVNTLNHKLSCRKSFIYKYKYSKSSIFY